MKILSKYKDYYDYLSGIWGVDPKIVLDRRNFGTPVFVSKQVIRLYIAGQICDGWYEDGKFYWGEQLEEIANKKGPYAWYFGNNEKYKSDRYIYKNMIPRFDGNNNFTSEYFCKDPYPDKDNHNKNKDCAILIKSLGEFIRYPKLIDMGVNKGFPAEDIYLLLSTWLAPKDDIPNNQTNNEKILSNGFDLKTSFRKGK